MHNHRRANFIDQAFTKLTLVAAFFVILLMAGFFVQLLVSAWPAINEYGFSFFIIDDWYAVGDDFLYGAWPALYGTLVTSIIAMLIAAPAAFLISMFLVEIAHPAFARPMSEALDLLAAIPSIVYGMWGILVLVPLMSEHVQPFLASVLGFLPIFKNPGRAGTNVLTAGIVLAIMILPYITAIMRDTFKMVPAVVKESAYGSGATVWEVTRDITMRYGMQGMIGALFIGLGRALGETMAVFFVIGSNYEANTSLFEPGTTVAAWLAAKFAEARGIEQSALFYLALILLILTFSLQVVSQMWLAHVRKRSGAGL